jgi:hypothetical protein
MSMKARGYGRASKSIATTIAYGLEDMYYGCITGGRPKPRLIGGLRSRGKRHAVMATMNATALVKTAPAIYCRFPRLQQNGNSSRGNCTNVVCRTAQARFNASGARFMLYPMPAIRISQSLKREPQNSGRFSQTKSFSAMSRISFWLEIEHVAGNAMQFWLR